MITSEMALDQLVRGLSELNWDYTQLRNDEKQVRFNVVKGTINIPVWFDADKQAYGFDMLTGGCKSYASYDEFIDYFGVYCDLNLRYIPTAKLIADNFEAAIGRRTVYDRFSGNKQQGYVVHFKVLGTEHNAVLIERVSEGYAARFVEFTDNGASYKVLMEYRYDVTDEGNLITLPTSHSYENTLNNLYKDHPDVKIIRKSNTDFLFGVEGIDILVCVNFVYSSIIYHVLKVGKYEWDTTVDLNDPYDLSELYLQCKTFFDDMREREANDFDAPEEEPATMVQEDAQEDVQVESQESIEEEPMEQNYNEDELIDQSDDFIIKLVRNRDESIACVEFVVGSEVYLMSTDVAVSLGIPVDRIASYCYRVVKRGFLMTEDEVALHHFAKDVSEDADMCKQLFDRIFS